MNAKYAPSIYILASALYGLADYDFQSASSVIEARSGRGLVELIRHLSHLSVWGWVYIICSATVCVGMSYGLKRLIPMYMRWRTKLVYPEFKILIMPHVNMSLSVFLFFLLFAFCGYWGQSSDDVTFFHIMGGVFVLFCCFPVIISGVKNKIYVENKGVIYYASFTFISKYKRLDNFKYKQYDESDKKKTWTVFDDKHKRLFKIDVDMYSPDGYSFLQENILAKCEDNNLI